MDRTGAGFGAADADRAGRRRRVARPNDLGELGIVDVFEVLALELARLSIGMPFSSLFV